MPRAVNPNHLEPVTQAENNRREAAAITQCPSGHEYTDENTLWKRRSDGGRSRSCRQCGRQKALARIRAFHAQGLTSQGRPWKKPDDKRRLAHV